MNKNIGIIVVCILIGVSIIISGTMITNSINNLNNEIDFMSVNEVADHLGMSTNEFKEANMLNIPHIDIKVLIERSVFKDWIRNNSEKKLKIYYKDDQLYFNFRSH